MDNLISVLVVDDLLVQREGIAKVVEATGKMRIAGTVSNLIEARKIVQSEPVDLALIDLVLKEQYGKEVGWELRHLQPELKVVIYTHEKSMVLASEIFRERNGISHSALQGYLLTRNISSSDYILEIYHKILLTGYFIDPDVLRWYFLFSKPNQLTRREEDCALLISCGLSNAQIADRMVVSRRRVENLINSLYQKFHILGNPGDPARRVVLAESARLLLVSPSIPRALSVMVVEDQGTQCVQLCKNLTKDGRFKVLEAVETGQNAIQTAFRIKPDLILVDVCLPDMDGFQVTRQILEGLPQSRVIVNSVDNSTLYKQKSIQAGAIGFLSKKLLNPDALFNLYCSADE